MKLSTRQIVVAGLFAALAITLGATGWGFIPIPTPAGAATIMQIPVIMAGILEGPLVGSFVGLIFSLFTIKYAPPWVVIPMRLLIGPAAYFIFKGVRRLLDRTGKFPAGAVVAATVAGLIGSAVNTSTLVLAVIFGLYDWPVIWTIAIANGIPEALLSAVVAGVLITPLLAVTSRGQSKR